MNMSILQKLLEAAEGVKGLNGVYQGLKTLIEAEGTPDTAAAASQLAAELAATKAVPDTVRTSMSLLHLGLAVAGQRWKWEALSSAASATSGSSTKALIDWASRQDLGIDLTDGFSADVDAAAAIAVPDQQRVAVLGTADITQGSTAAAVEVNAASKANGSKTVAVQAKDQGVPGATSDLLNPDA